jgi:chitin synthase
MSAARKIHSYRYVQGASSAPSLDEDDYLDYQDDGDDHDDYDVDEQEPQIPAQRPQGHSPSRTLQYALEGSSSLSSQAPRLPTFDSIAEAVTNLQSRFSSTPSTGHNAAPPPPRAGAHTPPYERPPSSASSASSYTVATDYAAPARLRQANRFQSGTRPLSQQPPFLPTIDSGEPLQRDNTDIAEEYLDPFSDGSHSQQPTMLPYASEPLRRRSLDSSASRDSAPGDEAYLHHLHHPPRPPSQLSAATSRSAGSSNRGPSVRSATPSQWHVLPFPASSQENIVEPTIGLVSKSNLTQQPQYNPVQSQVLTTPTNRIVQRRSPQKPVTPIDHFRHDTEAFASGRDSLLAYTTPRSRSPTPPIGDDSYEAASSVSRHHTGTTQYAETQPTVTSQYTGGTGSRDDEEYDGESLGDEDRDGAEEEKKEKSKSKFQEYLEKARSQGDVLLNQTPDEETKLQNVFADPRRVIFPNPPSADVPETPIETRHFGPAPVGRVTRRHKTTKRVPLTNGNLVLDLPVPPKLVLPRTGHPEVMKTRYTAVTCDPDDFERNGHFLRQNQTNRRTELFICITMYNVSGLTRSANLNCEVKSVSRKTRFCSAEHCTALCAILRTYVLVKTHTHGELRHGRRSVSSHASASLFTVFPRW